MSLCTSLPPLCAACVTNQPALVCLLPTCPRLAQNKVLVHLSNISGPTDAAFTYFGAALGGEFQPGVRRPPAGCLLPGATCEPPPAWCAALSSSHRTPGYLPPPSLHAPANEKYTYEAARLVVRVQALDAAAATVTVCRRGAAAENAASCANRLDLNCDGLAGQADPTCRPFLSALTTRLPTPSKEVRRPSRAAAPLGAPVTSTGTGLPPPPPAGKRTARKRMRRATLGMQTRPAAAAAPRLQTSHLPSRK